MTNKILPVSSAVVILACPPLRAAPGIARSAVSRVERVPPAAEDEDEGAFLDEALCRGEAGGAARDSIQSGRVASSGASTWVRRTRRWIPKAAIGCDRPGGVDCPNSGSSPSTRNLTFAYPLIFADQTNALAPFSFPRIGIEGATACWMAPARARG
jgi:hypothetical protein